MIWLLYLLSNNANFSEVTYCVGNIIGPHAFIASESPKYSTGCKVILACSVAQFVIAFALRMLLLARNKKRDAAAPAGSNAEFNAVEEAGGDLTDFEVRYTPFFFFSFSLSLSFGSLLMLLRIKISDIFIDYSIMQRGVEPKMPKME